MYRPLAVLLAVLLAPALSWIGNGPGLDSGRSPFRASAQTLIGGCGPSQPNAIIQVTCPSTPQGLLYIYISDLYQLESDAVNAYLGLHGLPAGDAQSIYSYGRADLRSAVRATMVSILIGIINKPPAQRTTHEQNLYKWLQTLVQQNEIAEYTSAIHQYNAWKSDPCHFTLDSTIASEYGLSYNGYPFCGGSLSTMFGGPPVPAESYFTAYGLKNSYLAPASTNPTFSELVAQTGADVGEVAGIATAASAVVAGIAVGAIAASASAALAAFDPAVISVLGLPVSALASNTAAFVVSGASVDAFGGAAFAAGPAAIILIALTIGVVAAMEVYSNQQTIDDLNNLTNTLTQVTNTPPDLSSFISDASGLGMWKLQNTLLAQTLPDVPSTAALPAHQNGIDPAFSIGPSAATAASSTTLSYQDWNGLDWSAQTSGGWFVQTCNSGATCKQADSFIASISYVDWSGTNWTASRLGNDFVSTKAAPASTDQPCPADPSTGVTPMPASGNFSACSSYVSPTIPLKDASGNLVTVSLVIPPPPPAFTSPTTLSFTPGQPSIQTITASGTPAPTISATSNPLPAPDFQLNCPAGFGNCQLSFGGNPLATPQNYQLTLQASNPSGASVTQTFSIVVNSNLAITSPSTLSGTAGIPINFTITTTGLPSPALTISGVTLPQGLIFTDHGNGTATISGTTYEEGITTCSVNPFATVTGCGITATNSNGSVSQPITISIAPAAPANLVGPASTTFIAGLRNSVLVRSSGATTPVSYIYSAPTGASWLVFHDNGNGTGVLSGTPPPGTTGTYSFTLRPMAAGSNSINLFNYTLTVVDTPVFLSANSSTFTVGTYGSFEIQTNGSPATTSFVFPQGVAFTSGNPASITGTPAPGSGGIYTVPIVDNAGSSGSATQQFTLNIYEAPRITSSNTATLFTGVPGYLAVTTSGYPSLSTQPLSSNPAPPTSPTEGQGMYFTVTGLPTDLQFSNLNPQGLATGTLTIHGTPSSADAGTHQVTITATNGVGVAAQQTLTLDIIKITGLAPTSGKTCNGNYNGTFNGSITVSAGQNCGFVDGGGVTGNVAMTGGNFTIAGGTVVGNVQIQGASAFSFSPGTKITGNLAIDSVASAAVVNQVCGTTVSGNVQVLGNASQLTIGSASPDSCPGNSIGGNLAVTNNVQPIAVYNNSVGKNLSCSLDHSITGAGNTAEAKQGQCAAF
jgi:hypothetical protein